MNEHRLSRRTFLAAAAATCCAASLSAQTSPGANGRLSVGLVGAGDRGRALLQILFGLGDESRADLTAVCDLWKRNRERGAQQVKDATGREPRQFARLEEMLAARDLDAVVIATPDHGHARQLTQCLQAGKHVYLEKPFANGLEEADAALTAWRRSDKVVTVGTQRRSHPYYRAAAELVRSGELGPIVQVDVVENHSMPSYGRRDAEVKELREADTDWKAFLQGKPARPFDPRQYLEFRLYRDFSTGIIGLWMSHHVDVVHMLTGAAFPKSAVAHGGTLAWRDGRENGDTAHVILEYPEGFIFSYSASQVSGYGNLGRVLGRRGSLDVETQWRIIPQAPRGTKAAEPRPLQPQDGVRGEMLPLHLRNWLECVRRGQRQTHCTPEHGYAHAVACVLADQALHRGRRMTFDPVTKSIREG